MAPRLGSRCPRARSRIRRSRAGIAGGGGGQAKLREGSVLLLEGRSVGLLPRFSSSEAIADRPTLAEGGGRRPRRPMNGGEPVTWIVLHWQRCTVAPEAVAMALAASAVASASAAAAPQMQKIVGRRLSLPPSPQPPLLPRRPTDLLPQRVCVWLGRTMNVEIAAAPSLPPSFSSLFSLSWSSPSSPSSGLDRFLSPSFGSSRSLAGPALWRRGRNERQRYG